MRYNSVHIYGADVQLVPLADDREEAIDKLLNIMEGVNFDDEEDCVIIFEGEDQVFSYEEYLMEMKGVKS